ncbi:MAG TPA: hypothetical protein VGA99_02335 [bacterium]
MKVCRIVVLALLIGCGQDDKQNQTSAEVVQLNGSASISWQTPQGWVKETPQSGFRIAQFRIPKVDSDPEDASGIVFYFRGEGGGVQSNLERWYGQFLQPDGRSSKEVAQVKEITVNGLKQTRVDVSGTFLFQPMPMGPTTVEKPNFRMLAAVVECGSGPVFVKLVGPQKTIEKWQESYQAFMNSFKQ